MASVQPRRSTRTGVVTWRVMFRVGHTQRQESFDDKASADLLKRQIDSHGVDAALKLLAARANASDEMPTLREFTRRYLDAESGLLTGIEPGTRAGYKREAERSFLPMLGEFPVDAIDKADIGRWLAWQESQRAANRPAQTIAAKTVRNYHALLSSVLSAAVEERLRPDNPAYRTRITQGTRREGVFLSPEEFASILHFIPEQHQSLVMFLAGTGCRWGEATAVTWGDLNLRVDPATVRIDKAWKKGETGAPVLKQPKSRRSIRTVSLTPDVVAALGAPRPSNELLFPSRTGGHLWYQRFRDSAWVPAVTKASDVALCADSGLTPLTRRPTIHGLRHTHASWLIAAGVPLPYIQARLGHESIQTTANVYGHLVPDAHKQMSAVIGQTMSGVRSLKQLG